MSGKVYMYLFLTVRFFFFLRPYPTEPEERKRNNIAPSYIIVYSYTFFLNEYICRFVTRVFMEIYYLSKKITPSITGSSNICYSVMH